MPSLWTPASWRDRLAELEAQTPEHKTTPLRRDVRSLGVLLGVVLRAGLLVGNLGLLHEQMDPGTGAMLGNMPQALSHLALVHAALAVDEGAG